MTINNLNSGASTQRAEIKSLLDAATAARDAATTALATAQAEVDRLTTGLADYNTEAANLGSQTVSTDAEAWWEALYHQSRVVIVGS